MHQAESSSSLFCLWTGLSLPAALHPVSRRRSCLQLRTDQCFCPMRNFTPLLLRTLRRTSCTPFGVIHADTPTRRHADTPTRRHADTPIRRYADTNCIFELLRYSSSRFNAEIRLQLTD